MKKKLTYMLSVTSDYVFAAGNIVLALIRHRPQKDFDVTIFYEDMLETDKRVFEKTGICNLIKYEMPEGFEYSIRTRCPKFNNEEFAKHFSFLKFAKFEIFTLLEKYENAVWLDADISVQSDPYDIIHYPPFAITADSPWPVQNNFIAPIEGYDMNRAGVCSAVFLISDKMPRWREMREWCYRTAVKVSPYFKNIDQGIFNLLLQEFNIDYKLLPLREYQCIATNSEAITAKLAHFGTKTKVWTDTRLVSCFPEWWRVHQLWLSLGGSDFVKPQGWSVVNAFCKISDRDKRIERLENDNKRLKSGLNVLPETTTFCVLNIPLLKRKIKKGKAKYYLFGFIHIMTVRDV